MKSANLEIVAKTATLARLKLSADEQERMSEDFSKILAFFDAINRPEISALAPLGHPLNDTQPLRQDIAVECDMSASIQTNAPAAQDGFITVPKVIE